MNRQTLRDRVHRYCEADLDGLRKRCNTGAPPRKPTPEQEAKLAEWARAVPKHEQRKVVRWRLVDLRDEIARPLGVQIHERFMGKLMARLNISRISVRPQHPKQDAAAQETHKKTSPNGLPPRSLRPPAASASDSGGKTKHASASRAA